MKRWHSFILLLLLAAAAWVVISYPVGGRVIEVAQRPTPTPSPRASEGTATSVTLLFAGDTMLSRSVGDMMAAKNDWSWPFTNIASTTRAADIAFANLETTISTRGAPTGCGYCFRADPKVVRGLTGAGFDVLSVANNHIHDYGSTALADTLANVKAAGMNPVGDSGAVIRTVRNTRIAYLAYAEPIDEGRMAAEIARARPTADVVVVSLHMGTEYALEHNAAQERIAHAAVDAGADLVVGTHPHVVQDSERYRGKWIFYSLGNFVFDQNWSDATRHGLVLSATVRNGAIVDVSQVPIEISKQYQVLLP